MPSNLGNLTYLDGTGSLDSNNNWQLASASNPVPVSASVSVGGFQPNGSYANLSVTTSSASVALPTGATVVVFNTGAQTAYINLGTTSGVAATTLQIPVAASGWLSLTVGVNTYLAAITSTGTTSLTISGGVGLATGIGGSSASGGNSSVGLLSLTAPTAATQIAGQTAGGILTQFLITGSGALVVDGSAVTQPVSGTVTANAGTNMSTAALALESGGNLAAIAGQALAQGSTTSGQKGYLEFGAVTTAAPSYSNAQSSPFSLTTAGGLRSDLSSIGGTAFALGQGTQANSLSVTLASNDGLRQTVVTPSTTTAPPATLVIAGKTNDTTPKYSIVPLGANGVSVITSATAASVGGATPYSNTALTNTAAAIKASAGSLYGFTAYNPNAAISYIQFLDATSPTVGSTTPVLTYPVPANGWYDYNFSPEGKVAFANAIKIAATTTSTGSTAPSSNLVFNAVYN